MAERKTLLLTETSRDIGHATVKYFNATNWRVFTASRQSWASECPWANGEESRIHLDLEDIPGVGVSLEPIREKLGDGWLHTLVDNAGISSKGEGGERLGVLETNYAIWLWVFNVNLFFTTLPARGLLAELEAAQGTVVNMTSIVGSKVCPFVGVAHATSKAALPALTYEVVRDSSPHRVWVNAIASEEIDTSILSPDTKEIAECSIPLHRLGQPEEITPLIYFLCISGTSYANGTGIHVNGGRHV